MSSSWTTRGLETGTNGAIYSLSTFAERNLGLGGNGSYGYDTVRLGLPGSALPSLEKQVVAGIWTNDFFLGTLGLSPVPFNFTSLEDPQPSMLRTLRNQSLIPSTSWAYTAGAYYQSPPSFGSLTLGGFDSTRFVPNNLSFAFGADLSRDLLVSLHTITYDTAGSSPLLANSIDIFIDSLVTELWLPADVCERFASQFNLTWNTQGQLYLVDGSVHQALLAQNPTFTFTIGASGGGEQTLEIVLPYAAFDLNLTAPIVGSTTNYFPLKQANSSQYTLGRVFLQEAYVIADYDRGNFSVSQALFPSTSVKEQIVTIQPPGSGSMGAGLGTGAIAGIAVAIVAIIALTIAVMLYFRRRSKQRHDAATISKLREKLNTKGMVDNRAEVQEADGDNTQHVELPAHVGPLGRHEMICENVVHEMSSDVIGRDDGSIRSTPIEMYGGHAT